MRNLAISAPHRAGFTLIELMVSVVIIAVLVTLGFPTMREMWISGHLDAAKVYLSEIAAKERTYFTRRGVYLAATNEQDLEDKLGVNLEGAGNFCFVVRTSNFISGSGTGNAAFEVWAVLRSVDDGATVAVMGSLGVTCTAADVKNAADGWVGVNSDDIGGSGRVVVLRYPPPTSGLDTTTRTGRPTVTLHWDDGISITDPLL